MVDFTRFYGIPSSPSSSTGSSTQFNPNWNVPRAWGDTQLEGYSTGLEVRVSGTGVV